MAVLEWFILPLRYDFILRGLGAGLLAALVCAALSCFVVWRGWAFIGEALSHAMLPGIVLASVLGFGLLPGGLLAAFAGVLGIAGIRERSNLREDSAIGIIYSGFFALGIIMLNKFSGFRDLSHILFGSILGVSPQDLVVLGVVTLFILMVIILGFKEFLTASFDPAHAAAIGLSPNFIRYLLLFLLALTTVIAVRTVGVVLVVALLVTPAATASLISKKLGIILFLSVFFATISTVIGFYISYYADLASGPVIVLTLIFFFVAAMVVSAIRPLFFR